MATQPVSGASIGLAAAIPSGLTSTSTNAEKVTAYEALTYTRSASCIVTSLPMFDEYWDTGEDPDTVCDDLDSIKKSFKTIARVSPASMAAIFDKTDPLIILFNQLRTSRTDIATLEITHTNGTDKIWSQIQVNKTSEDFTDTLGKVMFNVEFFFEARPVRN